MKPLRIAITTGDADGIGLEISSKALAKLGPQKGVQFVLWRSTKASRRDLLRLDRSFKRKTVATWHEAQRTTLSSAKEIVDIASPLAPGLWVEQAAQAAMLGHIDAIATAPISKMAIKSAGLEDIGHTDILKRVANEERVFMGFLGSKFSVVLATGHIPLAEVSATLTPSMLNDAVEAALILRSLMDKKRKKRPIAILGLNPHAGEGGIIGQEELNVHQKVLDQCKSKKLPVYGPLTPDSAFFQDSLDGYSVYVASYHDQGLIPFKSIHGHESNIHITLGLPFVRTSVDHGTAKDIFGKNKADASSMTRAVRVAIDLCVHKLNLSLD
jgi:4-hydroxythreonine-4-phosphate dehydrogenase